KSILCLPCHVATFSIGDWTTIIALLIFTMGMGGLVALWFSGGRTKRSGHRLPGGFSPFVVALVADVLFIQKLYRLSPARWFIHALIYYPILMRLTFGMIALGLSLMLPDMDLTRSMQDKNHPLRALFFDLTGLMIITGVCAALIRPEKDPRTVSDLPAPGRGMTMLLGLMVLVGFILEGLRIAMTGWPNGAHYALIGYSVSLMVQGMTGITDIYGYVWYAHAILTGVFVALIPFTRMIHMLTTPVVLMAEVRSRIQANH
nr:respiratory nitrate reductase subunit gamma [Desulfobacterales bacterium]